LAQREDRPHEDQEANETGFGRLFRRLWASQFATVTMVYGMSLAGVAYLELQTGSSAGTGLVILSSILPAFLASLVAGAVVDRFGRRPTLLVSHLSRAFLAIGFWAGTRFLSPGAALAAIALFNVGTASFGQFAFPAELSLVPDLVPRERVPRANAILQFGMLLGEGLGIILLAPLLIRLWGVPAVGLSGALLCLTAMLLVFGLPKDDLRRTSRSASSSPRRGSRTLQHRPSPANGAATSPGEMETETVEGQSQEDRKRLTWADLKAGWQTIAADALLRLVVLQLTVGATLLLVLLSLVPGLANRHLDVAVVDAPFLILPGGLAFVIAATLVSRVRSTRLPFPGPGGPTGIVARTLQEEDPVHRGGAPFGRAQRDRGGDHSPSLLELPAWIAAGLLVVGFGTVLLGMSAVWETGLAVALLGITAIGLGLGAVVIPGRTILQQRPPRDLRARVIAGQLTLANATAVIPLLLGGTLADRLGLGPVMIAVGILAALAGLAGAGYLVHRSGDLRALGSAAPRDARKAGDE
jgi:MFS family permease